MHTAPKHPRAMSRSSNSANERPVVCVLSSTHAAIKCALVEIIMHYNVRVELHAKHDRAEHHDSGGRQSLEFVLMCVFGLFCSVVAAIVVVVAVGNGVLHILFYITVRVCAWLAGCSLVDWVGEVGGSEQL